MTDFTKIKELFDQYDSNKDGVLDIDELNLVFKAILNQLGELYSDKNPEELAQEGMNYFDFNNNGKIEYNEFVQLINFLVNEKGFDLK